MANNTNDFLNYDGLTDYDEKIKDYIDKKIENVPLEGYNPSFLDGAMVFSLGEIPEVEGNALIFDLDKIGTVGN